MLSDGILNFRLSLNFVLQMPISFRKHQDICVSALPAKGSMRPYLFGNQVGCGALCRHR
jgi:hypothetical protein